MKIFVVPSVYPNDVNSNYGIYVHNQCKGLVELGHEIIVLDASGYNFNYWNHSSIRGIHNYEKDGVRIYSSHYRDLMNTRLPYYSIKKFMIGLNKIFKIASRENGRPDLLHAHFSHIAGYGAYNISCETGIPYVVTEHHSLLLNDHINPIIKKNLKLVVDNSNAFICVSEQLRNAVTYHVNTSKDIKVVPNMINKEYQYAENIVNESFVFFSAGNLVKNKRFDYLIDAFVAAVGKEDHVLLKIAGSGAEMENLTKKIQLLGRTHQIKLLGALSQSDMVEQYKRSNCFLSASLYETFGIVYREALAIGRPVVATRNKGIEEGWDTSFGKLVEPNNIQEFSESIKEIMSDIGTFDSYNISKQCLDSFSEGVILTKIEDIYKEIKNDDLLKGRV